jgi:hypothetical protein
MCDDVYYYRDRVKELESINQFVRKNTLLQVQNKIEYILDERSKAGLPISGLNYALEAVRSMIQDGR